MLERLLIKNFGLIGEAELLFDAGMTVFTGETGAGKSMLIDAFSLAVGARGGVGFVKEGAKSATIEATFTLPKTHLTIPLLEEMGIDLDDDTLFLRRQVMAEGKTRCFANGININQGQMATLGATLADIHGQRDQQLLLQPRFHASLLDGFGGHKDESEQVKGAYTRWRNAADNLQALLGKAERRDQETELLTAFVKELSVLAPEKGEEEALAEERHQKMQGEKASAALMEAQQLFEENSPTTTLGKAERLLVNAAADVPAVSSLLEELANATNLVAETEANLARLAADLTPDPQRLEAVDERLHQLRALARKHNCLCDELPQKLAQLSADLQQLQNISENMTALEKEAQTTRADFDKACAALTKSRQKAAENLSEAVQSELEKLKMPEALFQVRLEDLPPEDWSVNGAERVAFYVRMNPGTPAAPLEKAASGGEVSRLMLALKVVFFKSLPSQTLVFDEIDTGVGGAVADAMGRCLQALASNHQVFAITHLPQVAARGNAHMQIAKKAEGSKSQTNVTPLGKDARMDEIARMLSGAEMTASAKEAAASLLKSGQVH